MAILVGFILCHFEFCLVVWHFCGKTSIRRMEKIQQRALHFVYGDFDTTDIPESPTQSQTTDLGTGQGEEHCYSQLQSSWWSSTELL